MSNVGRFSTFIPFVLTQLLITVLIAVVICLIPPFNLKDRFINVLSGFFMFVLRPFHRWQAKWPKWVKWLFAIVVIILFEEYFLKPLGQTMYPWRMDFGG